jgi:pimeloyl-ACP methyl ester carboxylesterase
LKGLFFVMRTKAGPVPVEVARAESARFHRPLLFLHGLWTGAWLWAPLGGYLSHRGWESWAPSLLEAEPRLSGHDAVLHALGEIAGRLPAPPIVVAHGTGVVTATILARTIGAPALVAIAPVVAPADGGDLGFVRGPRFWAARLGSAGLPAPSGGLARAIAGRAPVPPPLLRADDGAFFRALAASTLRLAPLDGIPVLAVAGASDPLVQPKTVAALAERQGWEQRTYVEKGHLPMLEPGWEAFADDLHRWIIRVMGADLLAFLEESEEGE